MKRTISVVIIVFLFIAPFPASAHPGKTDRYGGHKCIKGCEEWKLYFSEYHLHDKNGKSIRVAGNKKTSNTRPAFDAATAGTVTDPPVSIVTRTEIVTINHTSTPVPEDLLLINPLLFVLLILLLLLLVLRMNRKRS